MTVAVFDYSAWSALFPALVAETPEATATAIFGNVTLTILDNTDCSPVQDVNQRLALLNLLVAHVAILSIRMANGNGASAAMVGNVSSATEGAVTVAMAQYNGADKSGAWFVQTLPGAQYWQAVKQFTRALYIPGRRPYTGVPRYVGGGL